MTQILAVLGTRPEAIKLFPVILAMRERGLTVRTCMTGQHGDIADQILADAGISVDDRIERPPGDMSLDRLLAYCVEGVGRALDSQSPCWVMVQGDTTTALAATLTAYHRQIPVAHVEAGLRSGDLGNPWPEEGNRRMIGAIAQLHFAPTQRAREELRNLGVDPSTIHVVGNPVIDALLLTRERINHDTTAAPIAAGLTADAGARRIVLVTAHRRENWDGPLADIATAVGRLASRDDVLIVWPVHPNPLVGDAVRSALAGISNVALTEPLDYADLVAVLAVASLVLTDSGGLQEEAPAFGVPVLVLRDATERPEGIAAGGARLIGTKPDRILAEATHLLDDPQAHARMSQSRLPYGDGQAATEIANVMVARVHPPAR